MEALSTEQQLNELEAVCLTDKDLLNLYKDLIYDTLAHNNGDLHMTISDTHFEDINHNPSKEDL